MDEKNKHLTALKSQSPTALLRLPFGLRLGIDDAVSSNDCLLYVYCYGSYGKFLCNWRCDRGRATASLYPIHLASESANGEYYPAFLCLTKCFGSCKTGFEILDEPEEPVNQTDIPLPAEFHGDVQFEHVGFAYDPKKPLIKDLNFEVKAGQTVAIVGPTGAGKTTLINLLMRFYDVNEGAIKIDGIDTKKMARSDVRSLFGMVLQDAWLYEGTIGDNIRFGKLDATDYEVVDAAKTANVDHFIRTMPDGYEMFINSEGDNISLGQKQLLTIARAVISNPKILILDEATSSVDTRLEALIQKAMDKVMEGRTSFVIAHRLSTIREADLILVMDQGAIIEKGNHETLLAAGGFYSQLYQSQFSEEAE